MLIGTFIENFEDTLENLDKFPYENGRDDANHKDKLVDGFEIKKKDSMFEVSREGKVDVQHKTCTRKALPRSYTACCSSNPENPHNDEHHGEHDEEVKLCNEVPYVRDVTSADALHPGKVSSYVYTINVDLMEGVMVDMIASADNFMVT